MAISPPRYIILDFEGIDKRGRGAALKGAPSYQLVNPFADGAGGGHAGILGPVG